MHQSLLPEGEFADPVDNNGDTPIYYCAYRMYCACAKAFLDRGANLFHGLLQILKLNS
jgi:hypothetical protein